MRKAYGVEKGFLGVPQGYAWAASGAFRTVSEE